MPEQPFGFIAINLPTASTLNIKFIFKHIDRILKLILIEQHVFIGGVPNIKNLLTAVIDHKFRLRFQNVRTWSLGRVLGRCILLRLACWLPVSPLIVLDWWFGRNFDIFRGSEISISLDIRFGSFHLYLFVTDLLWQSMLSGRFLIGQIRLRNFR